MLAEPNETVPGGTDTNMTSQNYTEFYADDLIVTNPGVMYALIGLQLVFITLAIIGNTFLIVMIVREWRRSRRHVTAYFILNLALCDLLTAAFHQPMRLLDIAFDDKVVKNAELYCRINGFFSALISGAAFLSIVAISVDRHILVCSPMKARILLTSKRARITLLLIWLCTLAFMTPLPIMFTCVVHLRLNGERNTSFCLIDIVSDATGTRVYFYTLFTFYYVFPLCVITVSYSRVFYELNKGIGRINGKDENTARMLRTRRASARVMMCIALLFILCESPYFITFFYRSLGFEIKSNPVTILLIIECLPLICCAANPIVYGSHTMCNKKRFSSLICANDKSRIDRKDTYRSTNAMTESFKTPTVVLQKQTNADSTNSKEGLQGEVGQVSSV